ncbi:MAG TPA: hypothetical protein VFX16_13030 [Pseudonocardiaceae bacterium]|nr:hypothetical protein [Pseudonocardiaceae bacterium]
MVSAPTVTRSHQYQHAFWFALLLAVALTLGGTAVALGAYTADGQPATVVREYFAALSRGDAAAALGYGTVPAGPTGLLAASTLAAQNSLGPMRDMVVHGVRQHGDTAQVFVTYTVGLRSGPVEVSDTVPVRRHGHGWRLVGSAVGERISPGAGSALAAMAGSAVPTGEFPMFPGAVPVTYNSPDLTLAPDSSVVRFADGGQLSVDAEVTLIGRAAITPAVRGALTACLAGTAANEERCPVPDAVAGVPGSLRGGLTGQPALSFQVAGSAGVITVRGSVPVAGTYQELDENNIARTRTVTSTRLSAWWVSAGLHWDVS